MTGHEPTGIPPRNYRTRRDQLQRILNLQRILDRIKSCRCPEDCRGQQDRVPLPGPGGGNTGGDNPEDTPSSDNNNSSNNNSSSSNNNSSSSNNNSSSRSNNDNSSSSNNNSSSIDITNITFRDPNLDTTGDLSALYRGDDSLESSVPGDNDDGDDDGGATSWLPEVGGNHAHVYLPGDISRMAGTRLKARALATVGGSKSVTLERTGERGTLRMSLQVYADPQGYRTRIGYYADVFFKLDGPHQHGGPGQEGGSGPGQEGGPGPEERHIGFISSWRLSKQSKQYSHEEFQPWVTEWLRSELGDRDDDSRPFKETLRLLYDDTGNMQGNMNDYLIQSVLDETSLSELVFIEMLWVKYRDDTTGFQAQYSRQHIAPHALELLYSLMNNGTLPAWYTINLPITFIMRVGMPSDNSLAEMWLNEYPRNPGETEPDYCARISDHMETIFQIEQRYGYRKISNDHRVVVLSLQFPDRRPEVVNSLLEDETPLPRPGPQQIKPQTVLSSIRF